MDEVRLLRSGEADVPVEAEAICPGRFADLDADAIARLPVAVGNTTASLGNLFRIEGEKSDRIRIEGDCRTVKGIGREMTRGRIEAYGPVGMHLGAGMRGGEIVVHGDAGDWVGAEMAGGLIRIHGRAGNRVGSVYRGSRYGMRGGTIVVDGSAGHEVGGGMRRGLIVIGGDAEDFVGARMLAGTVFVFGRVGLRAGGGMNRGTIVLLEPPEFLPTFVPGGVFTPTFLRIYVRALRTLGVAVPDRLLGPFHRHHGDLAESGKGEILVAC